MNTGYGHFIVVFNSATSLLEVSKIAANGLRFQDIKPIVKYLDLSITDLSNVSSNSASTIKNWRSTSKINPLASAYFFRIDRVLKKGIEIFGSEDYFKKWINSRNLSLGSVPRDLLLDPIGIELVEEALDALHFGNVI
jgi:putative toxin-antitoxin system antitoxin component (TIGR02293 family)